jgi:hypothetical protein
MNKNSTKSSARKLAAEALANQNDDRREQLLNAADELRKDMEQKSLQVRDLISSQPPRELLGYLWAQLHMRALKDPSGNDDALSPDKEVIQTFQFALEYVHAVWACNAGIADEEAPLDVGDVATLFDVLEDLKGTTMMYCMVSSAANIRPDRSRNSSDMEFHAKSSWVLIRGHRYQVLEEEFFRFVLEPHAEALRSAYGMEFHEIAASIQAIADTTRTGFSEAVRTIQEGMNKTKSIMEGSTDSLDAAIEMLRQGSNDFDAEMSGAIKDLFYGGVCNLSRHTDFTPALLEDLLYTPGENTEFFADGAFKGTPMRTLPALIKPSIKLDEEYFISDGQFLRDSAYRAIQRGLLRRTPTYREDWNRRQKTLIEQSYPAVFRHQFAEAVKYSEVYFRDPLTGQWAETDLVMTIGDVMLVVEAKAGVMAMHSPATNFDRHERTIRELIVKAYDQCKRFTDYLSSASEVQLYNRIGGEFIAIGQLKHSQFRTILPIGLTVEAFTPFSALSKELSDVQPLLGKHPFISMSVDDLFVLNRFLPTTGELIHYLIVRQNAAGIPNAILFDEIDHLGAYIKDNRFDMRIRDQLNEADVVTWDSFSEVVDKYFEGDKWKSAPVPSQKYPEELAAILSALDESRPVQWLEMDAHIRDLSGSGRSSLAETLAALKVTLNEHPIRRFLLGGDSPMQVWLCRDGNLPTTDEMRFQGEVGCLAANAANINVLRISYEESTRIVGLGCASFFRPSIVQSNYAELISEAEHQRARTVKIE